HERSHVGQPDRAGKRREADKAGLPLHRPRSRMARLPQCWGGTIERAGEDRRGSNAVDCRTWLGRLARARKLNRSARGLGRDAQATNNQKAFKSTFTTRVSPLHALPMNCWKILLVTAMNCSMPARRWRVA